MKGLVFNIQKFCLHDGPGIRTTIFLKGCPLTCKWCSNPESQSWRPQLVTRDIKCAGCGKCATVCSENAIDLTPGGKRQIDWDRCSQCLKCIDVCIYGALEVAGKQMTVDEVVREAAKDAIFYENSGGGVTISGGETLLQDEFLEELLLNLKQKEIHVAVDTSGYAPQSVFKKIVDHVDLMLFDIKHLDPEIHRVYTGIDNEIILRNVRYVAQRVRTWFRMALITGINDSKAHIQQVAELAANLGIEKISLLPYHEGGKSKCRQIGKPYEIDGDRTPGDGHLNDLIQIASQYGIRATVRH